MLVGRWTAIALVASSILSLSLRAFTQTPAKVEPTEVEVCELVENPMAYDKQLVRFRGRLEFEFEGDTLDDHDCSKKPLHPGIWWTYSGDASLARSHQAKEIEPLVSPILRDTSFQTFEEHAHLRRALLPDRQPCRFRAECAYYDVVATFTGKFFAGERPPRRKLIGFGHMGCCHLFVIEKISDVAVQRTPVPADDQAFSCTTTEWQSEYPKTTVSSIDGRADQNRQFMMDQARSHGDGLLADQMKNSPAWQFVGLTGSMVWSSPDLLTTYTAEFPQAYIRLRKNRHTQAVPPSAVPPLMKVSRERCEPVAN